MSNCIQLHNFSVKFYEDEIDITKFFEAVDEYERRGDPYDHEKRCGCPIDKEDAFKHYMFWYFLSKNSEVRSDEKGKYLRIRFGKGRSEHTHRDFKQTIWAINLFMKKPKKHTFTLADEYDGFDELEQETVLFQPFKTIREQPEPYV